MHDIERLSDDMSRNLLSWLVESRIRFADGSGRANGAFRHGLGEGSTGALDQYTEITGYAVSLFTHLFRWHRIGEFRDIAAHAVQFLMNIQTDSGAFPDVPDPARRDLPESKHTFDTAMCTMGLADYLLVHPNAEVVASAERACTWLLGRQKPNGSFSARETPSNNADNPDVFFGDGSCIHVKIAMALLKTAAHTGENAFNEAARSVCQYTIEMQSDDGFFWSMPDRSFVFSHAHCYACEGLISAGAYLDEPLFSAAADRGVSWLAEVQEKSGAIRQMYFDKRSGKHRVKTRLKALKASDATAQAARLFLLSGQKYADNYARAIRFLHGSMMSPSGGLYYARGRVGINRIRFAWPAMFALQALTFERNSLSAKDLF